MSVQILNARGKTIAIKYFGGRVAGLRLDVMLPQNLMKDVGKTIVHEEHSPDYAKSLSAYIAECTQRGAEIVYRQPGIHGPSAVR